MYAEGDGVPRDYAEAMKWYRLAAAQYRLAAEQGDADAQSNLGLMYENGEGVPQDFVTAHMWLNIAAANGRFMASYFRDTIAERLTPADISEAQQRASVCMASGYQDCD